jgi:replicative DNA helicase
MAAKTDRKRREEIPPVDPNRPPPHHPDAERGVLGSALLECERVLDFCIERGVVEESFFFRSHAELFRVLKDMHTTGKTVDPLTVTERLKVLGKFDELGGAAFLSGLVDATPTTAHAEYYVELVHAAHVRRKIIEYAAMAQDRCFDPEKDADLILSETEKDFLSISESQRSTLRVWSEVVETQVRDINQIMENRKGVTGISSGFSAVDGMLMGFQPTDMIILAARPSMGKTSLALNFVEHIALGTTDHDRVGRPCAVFSLEMSAEQLVRRMICCHARVPAHQVAKGTLSNEYHARLMDSAHTLAGLPIYIDDSAGLDVLEVRSRARRMKKKYGIQFIVVDYLQLLYFDKYSKEGRQRETAGISGELKAMAKELKVPVVALSQLSRAPETRDRLAKPKLSDLRDSGSIEQDADVVMLLRRPCKYPDDPEAGDQRLAVLDIAKHRNGQVGEVRLNFEGDYTRFENRIEDYRAHDG